MLMKNTTVFMVLLACFLLAACGGRNSPVSSKGIRGQPSDARESASAALPRGPTGVMTEEDLRVAQMPLEQRIIYLQRRLEGMLEEMGKDGSGAKSASVITGDYNKVEVTTNPNEPKEDLSLDWDGTQVGWKLSFLERLCGDLDFSGTVNIADITPIAVYFGKSIGDAPEIAHLDRLTDGNGTIQIADISPIAMNFGESLRTPEGEDGYAGYKLYWSSSENGDWHEVAGAVPTKYDHFYPPEGEPLYRSKYDYWFNEDDWDGLYLTVCPVNARGIIGYRSEAIRFVAGEHPNNRPSADLKIIYDGDVYEDELVAPVQLDLTFDAGGSHDSDGTITTYRFTQLDAAGQETLLSEQGTPTLEYTYYSPTEVTVKLQVTDDGGATAEDTVYILATGPAQVLSFDTDVDSAECGQEVTFTATALDPDGVDGASLFFEFEFDYVDGQGGGGYGVPIEVHADGNTASCQVTHTFTRDSQPEHEVHYNSRVRVTNSIEPPAVAYLSDFPDESNKLVVTHAIPHLTALAVHPAAGIAPLLVTFRIENAYDLDEPDGLPATYYLDFGDEQHAEGDYTTEPIQHEYTVAGEYFATLTLFDDDECGPHESDPETVRICAFGIPREDLITHSVVDDGYYPAHSWQDLGAPCISIAVNPWTCQPGIAYTGNFGVERQEEYVESCALFSERSPEGAWPVPPDWVGGETNWVQAQGGQLDLEYDPLMYGEGFSGQGELVTVVTRYIVATYGTKAPNGPTGIYHFFTAEPSFDQMVWKRTVLVSSSVIGGVYHLCPIRMVAVNDTNPEHCIAGQFVHFFGHLYGVEGLWEASSLGTLQLVQEMYQPPATYDLKAVGDDRLGCGGVMSSAYLVGPVPYGVELETGGVGGWDSDPDSVNLNYDARTFDRTRSMALDYFGENTVGALWVADKEVSPGVREDSVVFRERVADNWTTEEVVSPHISGGLHLGWCDFDYEPLSGIGCAVYEWYSASDHHLELRLRINGAWTAAIPIADSVDWQSHVDMAIDDGYIYIAYSAPKDREYSAVWCAVADLLNRG